MPYLGLALTGYELYQWLAGREPGYNMAAGGWQLCCDLKMPRQVFRFVAGTASSSSEPCDHDVGCGWTGQVPSGNYGDDLPNNVTCGSFYNYCRQTVYFGPGSYGDPGDRMTLGTKYQRIWDKREGHPPPETPWDPGTPPVFLPPVWVPPWVPWFDPWQLPIGKPVPAPKAPPYRSLPRRNPRPRPRPAPVPAGETPTYEIEPGAVPVPGSLKQEIPPEGEKEKKGSPLRGKYSAAWVKFLEGLGGGFTEMDDLVSAIYKSLPWELRRWRGRDGVWRDRDHTTARRIDRISKHLGDVSVLEMVKNITANEAIDTVGGVVGELNKRALGNNRYYRGLGGLQQGGRFTKETWNDALEQLRLGAAENIKPRSWYRHYIILPDGRRLDASDFEFKNVRGRTEYGEGEPYRYADLSDLPDGWQWGRELVKGTKQKIPWLRYSYNQRVKPRRGTIDWWTINHDKSYNVRRVIRYASNT